MSDLKIKSIEVFLNPAKKTYKEYADGEKIDKNTQMTHSG